MSTLSEHTGNGNPTETSRQREHTTAQIYGILRNFDVLPSRFDRVIFKYIYVYLISLFFLAQLLILSYIFLPGISSQFQVGEFLLESGLNTSPVIVVILVLWRFNVWRWHTPKMLRDLFETKRIDIPDGDVNTSYLHFLENYRDALANPKRYFLSGFPMLLLGSIFAYRIVQEISVEHPNVLGTLLVVIENLLVTLELLAGVYCIGIVIWVMYISGWYVRKLVRVFEFRIQPFHPDQCGGLKLLGNFCFGLVSPILIGSGLTIGYILLFLSESGVDAVFLALTVGFVLLFLLLYAFPAAIFAFILPLRDIHTKLVSEGEADENSYIARIEALREEIQSLLDTNQVEEAKAVQEKKALVETLYTPYPRWPFRFRSKIFSTVLGVSGSLLIGVMTAALQQYFLPAILRLLFHTL